MKISIRRLYGVNADYQKSYYATKERDYYYYGTWFDCRLRYVRGILLLLPMVSPLY